MPAGTAMSHECIQTALSLYWQLTRRRTLVVVVISRDRNVDSGKKSQLVYQLNHFCHLETGIAHRERETYKHSLITRSVKNFYRIAVEGIEM